MVSKDSYEGVLPFACAWAHLSHILFGLTQRRLMTLCWMKLSLMTHAIIWESFLKVTGERRIHPISQAAGCRLYSPNHLPSNIILWTRMKGPVFICNIWNAACLSEQLYFAQVQLDRIYPWCMSICTYLS